MPSVPQPMHQTVARVYALHVARRDTESRPYLGASVIGDSCRRRLWLNFRWAADEVFDGRMLRLFDTGHREETRLLDELRAIGLRVEGQQHAVEALGGHLRGHLDAVVLGYPERPKTWVLTDVKTIKSKLFDSLLKTGIREAYPKYWAQGQIYMGLAGLERAVFFFVCKDDDRIQAEWFEFDRAEFDRLIEVGRDVIHSGEPPVRISSDPAWYECKLCSHHRLCHGQAVPAVTCRSCAHTTPTADGQWRCDHHGRILALPEQRQGCADHRFIPVLLELIGKPVDAHPEGAWVQYESSDGRRWINGAPPTGYTSREIASCDPAILGNTSDAGRFTATLRETFDARIIG